MSKVEPTYRWSRAEAEANGETELWLESYRINCDCARFIEKQISANYADNRLNEQGIFFYSTDVPPRKRLFLSPCRKVRKPRKFRPDPRLR